jgi:hypothetical protein
MIRFAIRLVTAVLSLVAVLFVVGIGILWFDGSRVIDRASASGWFTPKPTDPPMTVFESTTAKAMFGPTWNEKGFPCRTASRFWLHYAAGPDRRGLSISQVVARDISYEIEASQSLGSQARQLSVACLLESKHSDTELLRLWLRRANFGEGAVGLDAASQAIFNKAPSLLNAEESAKLIALIYQPSLRSERDKWNQRADLVARRAAAN